MKKRILLISGIVLAAGIIFTVLYFMLKSETGTSKAIDAVGGNPAVIIETKDFNALLNNLKTDNLIYQELNTIFEFTPSGSIIHCLDSLSKFKSVNTVLNPGNVVFCFDNSGDLIFVITSYSIHYTKLYDKIGHRRYCCCRYHIYVIQF